MLKKQAKQLNVTRIMFWIFEYYKKLNYYNKYCIYTITTSTLCQPKQKK